MGLGHLYLVVRKRLRHTGGGLYRRMGTDRQRGIPGVLMLDMTRTGGKRYTPGETERIIHDGFIVQVPMAFEDYTYLSVDRTARLLSAHSDGAGHGDLLYPW